MRTDGKKRKLTSLAMSMGLTAAALSAYMLMPSAGFAQSCNGGGGVSEDPLDSGSCDSGSGTGSDSGSNYCTDLRSLYECALHRIERMPTWEKVLCYANLPVCLAAEMAICASEGCGSGSGSGN